MWEVISGCWWNDAVCVTLPPAHPYTFVTCTLTSMWCGICLTSTHFQRLIHSVIHIPPPPYVSLCFSLPFSLPLSPTSPSFPPTSPPSLPPLLPPSLLQVKVIYVRNLMLSTTEAHLEETFSAIAPVERVKKIRDYAFVHFQQREGALMAIAQVNGEKWGRES